MNTDKEKQHYVPKFYLRNFSYLKNKKQIGVFNIDTNFYIQTGKLKTQAYRPFYYGKDGVIENHLAYIEGRVSPILASITNTQQLPNHNSIEHYQILLFTLLTHLRNPIATANFKQIREELIRRTQETYPEATNIPDMLPAFDNDKLIKMAIANIQTGLLYCSDLEYKLLINNGANPLITSDNPVIFYNQFLELKRWPFGQTGYGSMGLQIIVPLDPNTAIFFYDKWAYKVGDIQKKWLILSQNDVDQLNLLQILNCTSNVFFSEKISENYIKKIFNASKQFSKTGKATSHAMKKINTDGPEEKNGVLITVGKENLSINLNLSNVNVTKKAKQHTLDNRMIQLRPRALKLRTMEDQSR